MPGPLGNGLADLLVAGALLAVALLAGYGLLPDTLATRSAETRAPLALSTGALAMGVAAWLAGHLTVVAVPAVAGALAFLGLRRARRAAADLAILGRRVSRLALASRGLGLAALVPLAALGPQLLVPLADSDGVRYHVSLPKLFLLEGRVFFYPWDTGGAYPESCEMLNLLGLAVRGPEVARALQAGFFVLALAAAALLVHRLTRDRRAAALAPLFLAATPVLLAPAMGGFVDAALLFHVTTAALVLAARRGPVAGGLAGAAAMVTKITAPLALAGLAVANGLAAPKGRRLRAAVLFLAPSILAYVPYAVRNAVATGDPLYPAGRVLLGLPVPGVAADRVRYTTHFGEALPGPLAIAWHDGGGTRQADEVAGPHQLAGLAALVALAATRSRARLLFLLAAPSLAGALVFRPPARYLTPLFLAAALALAWSLAALSRRSRALAAAAAVLLAAPSVATALRLGFSQGDPVPYVTGRRSRDEFLKRALPGYAATKVVNALPPGGRVMALDFPAPLYFDRPWIAEGILMEPPLKRWLDEGASPGDLLARLRELDVRLLVVTPGYGGGTALSLLPVAGGPENARRILPLREALTLVARVDGVDVWEVPRAVPAPRRE